MNAIFGVLWGLKWAARRDARAVWSTIFKHFLAKTPCLEHALPGKPGAADLNASRIPPGQDQGIGGLVYGVFFYNVGLVGLVGLVVLDWNWDQDQDWDWDQECDQDWDW